MSNLKAALCPSCGGKLELPNDVKTARCTYCGVMVTIQGVTGHDGHVRDYTVATKLERVREHKPFDVGGFKERINQLAGSLAVFGFLALFISFYSGSVFGKAFGIALFAASLFVYINHKRNLKKIIESDKIMSQKGPSVTLVGYKGACPYCDTSIVLNANVKGDNCPACAKRIVVRESKFYSVDTPVANVNR